MILYENIKNIQCVINKKFAESLGVRPIKRSHHGDSQVTLRQFVGAFTLLSLPFETTLADESPTIEPKHFFSSNFCHKSILPYHIVTRLFYPTIFTMVGYGTNIRLAYWIIDILYIWLSLNHVSHYSLIFLIFSFKS